MQVVQQYEQDGVRRVLALLENSPTHRTILKAIAYDSPMARAATFVTDDLALWAEKAEEVKATPIGQALGYGGIKHETPDKLCTFVAVRYPKPEGINAWFDTYAPERERFRFARFGQVPLRLRYQLTLRGALPLEHRFTALAFCAALAKHNAVLVAPGSPLSTQALYWEMHDLIDHAPGFISMPPNQVREAKARATNHMERFDEWLAFNGDYLLNARFVEKQNPFRKIGEFVSRLDGDSDVLQSFLLRGNFGGMRGGELGHHLRVAQADIRKTREALFDLALQTPELQAA